MRSIPARPAKNSPATAAIKRATATGTWPSQTRKETVVVRVFCAMKTTSSTRMTPSPTMAAQKPLVREPRNGSWSSWPSGPSPCSRFAPESSAICETYPFPSRLNRSGKPCHLQAATRRLRQDRRLARLGPGVRREALHAAAHQVLVWLSIGLQSVGHRDEAWLERGLPSS